VGAEMKFDLALRLGMVNLLQRVIPARQGFVRSLDGGAGGRLISGIPQGQVEGCEVLFFDDEIEIHLRTQSDIGTEIRLKRETLPIRELYAQRGETTIEFEEVGPQFRG